MPSVRCNSLHGYHPIDRSVKSKWLYFVISIQILIDGRNGDSNAARVGNTSSGKAVDCENLAKDLPRHRVRLLGMAEHYWQLADKIDQPRVRPGSLTETFSRDVEAIRARQRVSSRVVARASRRDGCGACV